MSRSIKRKYRKIREEFKRDLRIEMQDNRALAMLAIETYTACQHREHIMKIWAMFRNPDYSDFHQDYTENLFGKHLTGSSGIWKSLHVAGSPTSEKYYRDIPEVYAMGDALGVAYSVLITPKNERGEKLGV